MALHSMTLEVPSKLHRELTGLRLWLPELKGERRGYPEGVRDSRVDLDKERGHLPGCEDTTEDGNGKLEDDVLLSPQVVTELDHSIVSLDVGESVLRRGVI